MQTYLPNVPTYQRRPPTAAAVAAPFPPPLPLTPVLPNRASRLENALRVLTSSWVRFFFHVATQGEEGASYLVIVQGGIEGGVAGWG